MDAERLERYADKFTRIEERVAQFTSWSRLASEDEMARAASFKAFQEIGDALAHICAMLTRDIGLAPKDDHSNIETLEARDIISTESKAAIDELTGIRDRLLRPAREHDEARMLSSATKLVPAVETAVEELRTWISENA